MMVEQRQLKSLGVEIKTATKLIHFGLAELQQISILNNIVYLPFLLLTSGFERLMKCMVCFLGWLIEGCTSGTVLLSYPTQIITDLCQMA